jgi:hypothetical protein
MVPVELKQDIAAYRREANQRIAAMKADRMKMPNR